MKTFDTDSDAEDQQTHLIEDREDEKRKLEQKFRESDTKVDQVGVAAVYMILQCCLLVLNYSVPNLLKGF